MKLIGIYPGNFQPPTKAHFEAYKRLRQNVGPDTFVTVTDRTPTPEAPLNAGDKEQILVRHGIPASNIQRIQDWKKPEEIFHKFSSNHTGVIFALNQNEVDKISKRKVRSNPVKDKLGQEMDKQDPGLNELAIATPEKEVWMEGNGKPNYFQPYKGNESSMEPFQKHGYVLIIDDTKVDGHPITTQLIRQYFGSSLYTDEKKKMFFRLIFGWFDIGLYTLISSKFKQGYQVSSTNTEQPPEEMPPISRSRSQPITVPQARVPSAAFKENITKLVHEILREIMDEDIMSTSTMDSSNDGSDTSMSSALDKNKDLDKQKSDNATQIKDLNQQKKEAEAEAKKNKQQRDQYSTVVKNYDAYQKKNDRERIDTVNRELRQPKQPIAPIA